MFDFRSAISIQELIQSYGIWVLFAVVGARKHGRTRARRNGAGDGGPLCGVDTPDWDTHCGGRCGHGGDYRRQYRLRDRSIDRPAPDRALRRYIRLDETRLK